MVLSKIRGLPVGVGGKGGMDLMESGQLMPAAELVRVREEEARQAAAFEEAVQSEQSLSRTRIPREKVESIPVYIREPFQE